MKHGQGTIVAQFPFLALTARAEALDYMSVAQQWNVDTITPEILTRACAEVSAPDCMLHWNTEEPKNYWRGAVFPLFGDFLDPRMCAPAAGGAEPVSPPFAIKAGGGQKDSGPHQQFAGPPLLPFLG